MRRLFTILLMLAATASVWAFTFSVGDLQFESTSNPREVVCSGLSSAGKEKASLDLRIPRMVVYNDGTAYTYYVKGISGSAFIRRASITGVTLEYGIEEIGRTAFYDCSNMTYVRIPSSVTSVGSKAFEACSKLTKVYYAGITPNLKLESGPAFPSNNPLPTLYIPKGAYREDFKTSSAFSSSGFSDIKNSSYSYDIYMSDGTMAVVTTPSTSTSVDHECSIIGFNKNGSGTGVAQGKYAPASYHTKPSGQDRYFKYTKVANQAFQNNTDLTSIDLSNVTSLIEFGSEAASGCTNLTSAKFASGKLDAKAFNECSKLTDVTLDGVTSIGTYAFQNCNLDEMNIPATTTYVAPNFINGNSNITAIIVDKNNPKYASAYGVLYSKNYSILYRSPQGKTGEQIIESGVEQIVDGAFDNCSKITSIELPYGVKTIGYTVFYGCSSLTTLKIPSTVTSIEKMTFYGCKNLSDFYINCPTPPSMDWTAYFGSDAAKPNLYVPSGKVDAYKNAGWTGFKSYNKDNCVAYDERVEMDPTSAHISLYYNVTTNKSENINGTTYNGRAKIVRARKDDNVKGKITIPAYIKAKNRKYAVTKIDDLAFTTTQSFYVKGCENVDTVGKQAFDSRKISSIELPHVSVIEEEAFDDCTSLTTVNWGNSLKRIEKWGFCNAPLTNDIILPVGFEHLGYQAFKEAKSQTILVPSTLRSYNEMCFNRMQYTSTFIINAPVLFKSDVTLDFDKVPTTATIYVPVGQVDAAKAHKNWKRFSNIMAGAFDFTGNASLDNSYTITVTDNTPVTVDGVTYDGKAKYVYNPRIKSKELTGYQFDDFKTDKMCGGERKYLMTEIGDEMGKNSLITDATFENMLHLERIGTSAFEGSKLQSATMPNRKITFGANCFSNISTLTELVIPYNAIPAEGRFFANNNSNFQCYVNSSILYNLLSQYSTHNYSSTEKCSDRLAPCFIPSETTFNLANYFPLDTRDFPKAYTVYGLNSNGLLVSNNRNYIPKVNSGVILADLTPGKLYKVPRNKNTGNIDNSLQAVTSATSINISNVSNAYYWDASQKKFKKPNTSTYVESGRCYLVMAGGADELYLDVFPPASTGKKGDVNGDGTVDVTDVNLAINVMLGKATMNQYPKADVNGDGTVDVTDVNLIINAMLGK